MAHRFTIGVEEEFQIVDPVSGELRSHVSELIAASAPSLGDQIKQEMHQSIVEVGTNICADVKELRGEMMRMRAQLSAAASSVGLAIAAAGTHLVAPLESVAAVGNIYTRRDRRGRGLGTAVTAAVTAELRRRGVRTIGLNVNQRNATAIGLYERLGFVRYCAFVEGVATR